MEYNGLGLATSGYGSILEMTVGDISFLIFLYFYISVPTTCTYLINLTIATEAIT